MPSATRLSFWEGLDKGAIEKPKKARKSMYGGDHYKSLRLFSGARIFKDSGNTPELAYRALLRQVALKLADSGHVAMRSLLRSENRADDVIYFLCYPVASSNVNKPTQITVRALESTSMSWNSCLQ